MRETWYFETYVSLGLEHRLHLPYEKSIVDRTEAFDDHYPCMYESWIIQSSTWSQLDLFYLPSCIIPLSNPDLNLII
jgi:hypothetical protein